jgi:hypothetical protein
MALCTAITAHASDRRKVAVISLSGDPEATALRRAFYDELQIHWALRALGDPAVDTLLQGGFDSEDSQHLDDARKDLADAEEALGQFDYKAAARDADAARQALTWVTPTEMVGPYTDATLVLGQALLGEHRQNDAARAFALVHRLDPMRQLDAARYLPEIVDFFRLQTPSSEVAKLQVVGKGRAWIDGIDRGPAPATFEVGEGTHVVQLTGVDRITRGEQVTVPGQLSVEIPDQDAGSELKVKRARVALAKAPDPAARAGAMQELARLLDVHDAVLIAKRDDGLEVQTWRDRAPGFSELVAYHEQKPSELLVPLAPAKPPDEPKIAIPFTPPPHVDATPWYRKRWIQASIATGVVVGVVGAILYATRTQLMNWGPAPINTQAAMP